MILRKKTSLVLWVVFFTFKIFAASKQESIYLEADSVDYDYKKGVVFYRGNVRGEQGKTHLNSNTMTIFYNTQHKIEKIVAVGDPSHYSTPLREGDTTLHAWAKQIIYYPISGKVNLIENAKIQYAKNTFMGPFISYDMINQRVSSHPQKNSKAKIVLEPIKDLRNQIH